MKKGEVQVGEREREHDLAALRKEISTLVADKCVDPATQRPYPVGMIEKAMAEAGVSVKTGKNAKSQVRLVSHIRASFMSTGSGDSPTDPSRVKVANSTSTNASAGRRSKCRR